MAVSHARSLTEPSGGKKKKYYRKRKKAWLGREPAKTTIGETKVKKVRVRGGNYKFKALKIEYANVFDPKTGKFVEGGIAEQARQVLENLKAVLEAAGTDFSHVVKSTVYLSDIRNFSAFNEVYAEFFPEMPPARSAFQVAALPLGAMIEIEMIAEVEEAY